MYLMDHGLVNYESHDLHVLTSWHHSIVKGA